MDRRLKRILVSGLIFFSWLGYQTTLSQGATPRPVVSIEHYSLGTQTTQYQLESAAATLINKSHPWLRVRVIPGLSTMEGLGITEKFPPEKKKYVFMTGDPISIKMGALGLPPYPRKYTDVRMLLFWWRNTWGFATYNDKIKTPQDLKGKTIAVRPRGGSWDNMYEFVFKYCWGILDSVRLAPMAPGEFANAMLQGTADASHWGSRELYAGAFDLSPTENEMRLKRKTSFISLTKEDFERGVKNSGGNPLSFGWIEVPAGVYGGGDPNQGPVGMIYYAPGPVTWDVADPEVTYEYVKAIHENREKFAEFSPQWKGAIGGSKMCPSSLLPEKDISAGALKYCREQGWIK